MENITKALVILTVTAVMILATLVGVASTTQAAHADKGGIPNAHAGTHPLKSCISHPTQNKCTRSQVAV
jgi:hypothetical protein